jgi:hypothetical protein
MLRLVASLAVTIALATTPGGCDPHPVTPDGGLPRDPTDKTLVLSIWTDHEEPFTYRLGVFNEHDKPLVGDQGQNLANYTETVMTTFDGVPIGHPAVWEVAFDYKGAIHGNIKIDIRPGVKVGCELFSVPPLVPGKEQKSRVLLPHMSQTGKGPRFTCSFVGP